MQRLSQRAEKLLREITRHRDENGNCDTSYWAERFEKLSAAEDMLLRSIFKELIDNEMILVQWADDIPYTMYILGNGLVYFEETRLDEMPNNTYTNNFYGDVKGVQIQQGNEKASQDQSIENDYDEEKITELIQAIKKYDNHLESEFGSANAKQMRDYIAELSETAKSPESKGKTGAILSGIRDLCTNAGGGLIAAGIIKLLSTIL